MSSCHGKYGVVYIVELIDRAMTEIRGACHRTAGDMVFLFYEAPCCLQVDNFIRRDELI